MAKPGRGTCRNSPLLEWYRRDFGYDAFIMECVRLRAQAVASMGRELPPAKRRSYGELFADAAGLDPLTADLGTIRARAAALLGDRLSDELIQRPRRRSQPGGWT